MNPPLPHRVPKLEAKDMCATDLDGPDNTTCLIGWGGRVGMEYSHWGGGVVVMETIWRELKIEAGTLDLATYAFEHSRETSAALWNRTMLRLGYIDKGDHFEQPEVA